MYFLHFVWVEKAMVQFQPILLDKLVIIIIS